MYDGNVFRLEEHVDRLYDSAKSIMLNIEVSKEEMSNIFIETLKMNKLENAYIRVVISRGVGNLGLDPSLAAIHRSSSSRTARPIPESIV